MIRNDPVEWSGPPGNIIGKFGASVGKLDTAARIYLSNVLPLEMAEFSRCNCRSLLKLKSFVTELRDGTFSFSGLLHCPKCANAEEERQTVRESTKTTVDFKVFKLENQQETEFLQMRRRSCGANSGQSASPHAHRQ